LRNLELVFPQGTCKEDWELLPHQNILSDKPSLALTIAKQSLSRFLDWLPPSTKVTVIRANFASVVSQEHREGAKDRAMEEAAMGIRSRG